MKCNDRSLLQGYVHGTLSPDRMSAVSQHLNQCNGCNNTIIELNQLQISEGSWNLKQPVISDQEVDLAWNRFETQLTSATKEMTSTPNHIGKGDHIKMKKRNKHIAYVAAAILAVGIMTPPVRAAANDIISKVFIEHVETVEPSTYDQSTDTLINPKKNGQYFKLDPEKATITDQGISIKFTEVYVADRRVSAHYIIEDANGNEMKGIKPTELGTDAMTAINLLGVGEATFQEKKGMITFDLFNPANLDDLALKVDINQIEDIKGSWVGEISLSELVAS